MTEPKIRSRKPTGRVPWPVILIEGPEKSGKTWATYQLSASERVGQMYAMDLGEGSADEYGAIPGARYKVLLPAGDAWTWADIIEQVTAVRAEAQRVTAAGEPPVCLTVDSATDEWEALKDWLAGLAVERVRKRGGKPTLDANGDPKIPNDLWNIGHARHRKLMTLLLTFPGIVVITARGKVVAAIEDGRPVEGKKDYKVEAHKTLGYDASLWLRMSRDQPPTVIGCRSVTHGVQPGVDDPKPVSDHRDDLLAWLVFDVLGCQPATAEVRDTKHVVGGPLTADERHADPAVDAWMGAWTDQVTDAPDKAALAKLWKELAAKQKSGFVDEALASDLAAHWNAHKDRIQRAAASLVPAVAS